MKSALWHREILDRRVVLDRLENVSGETGQSVQNSRARALELFKVALAQGRACVKARADAGASHEEVASGQTFLMDEVVRLVHEYASQHAYPQTASPYLDRSALIAVGTHGQGKLDLRSEQIDLMVLLGYKLTPSAERYVEALLYMVWDLGLNVGHATRSIDDCIRLSRSDREMRNSLLDARYLCGDEGLYAEFRHRFLTEVVAESGTAYLKSKPPLYNPFRPGSIVSPGMFSGRSAEIKRLENTLFQTKHGNPQSFMILGERGIGKSSLIWYFNFLAKGQILSADDTRFRFITVNVILDKGTSFLDILDKTATELRNEIKQRQKMQELARSAWDFLSSWEIQGIKYNRNKNEEKERHLLDELTYNIAHLLSDAGDQTDGIVIMYDEADKPAESANLGVFCKLFSERLMQKGCAKVSIGLVGLPPVVSKLRNSHESAPRLFETLTLGPLGTEECVDVIRKGIKEAQEKNDCEVSVSEHAERIITEYSEGYPHMLQQFAYSAFEADVDRSIDVQDAIQGAYGRSGAIYQLGVEYFHEKYFDGHWSNRYRKVLQAMSRYMDGWVTIEELQSATGIAKKSISNALSDLQDRNIVIASEIEKGSYRLPTKVFAIWIKAFATS